MLSLETTPLSPLGSADHETSSGRVADAARRQTHGCSVVRLASKHFGTKTDLMKVVARNFDWICPIATLSYSFSGG